MDKLGNSDSGVQILPAYRLILTNTEDKLEFDIEDLVHSDLRDMIEYPKKTYAAFVAHRDSLDKPIMKDIVLAAFISYAGKSEDGKRVLLRVTGSSRVRIRQHRKINGIYIASIFDLVEPEIENIGKIYEAMDEILDLAKKRDSAAYNTLKAVEDPSRFADTILEGILDNNNDRVAILNTVGVLARLKIALEEIMEASSNNVPATVPNKKGKLTSKNAEVQELCDKYYAVVDKMPKKAKEEIHNSLSSLCSMNTYANDFTTVLTWTRFAVTLPFDKRTTDNEIKDVEEALEKTHYGMNKAKERLIEHLSIKKLNPEAKGCTILLDGPPGTGKTTLAMSLGKALGRKVERISLGGCTDPSYIKGHGKTYSGSKEGRIMQAIHSSGVKNPVIILDEVEKVQDGHRGSATSTLLELLDPKTNSEFTDAYLCFDFDLSEVLFIATSNERHEISPPVLDRMEYIACDGYSMDEKLKIALNYTIPEKAKEAGVPEAKITKNTLKFMIEGYTREAGMRTLEKAIGSCFRKVAVEKVKGKEVSVTKKFVEKRLGKCFEFTKPMKHNVPGIVSGMYYSTAGGGVLDIEAVITEENGSGDLILTGQAGDVMQESVELVKSHMTTEDYGMDGKRLNKWDIHVHMPEGATPKDGPSAGGAYSLLFASLLLDIPVRENLCLTGECNLHGHITPIGGLQVKCSGAIRAGMEIICLPMGNKRDFDAMPKYLKDGAKYHFVETVVDLIEVAFDFDRYINKAENEVAVVAY